MRILLVEDEIDLAESVVDYLETHACETICAPDGVSALHLATLSKFDALVVDIGLPRMDGLELVRRLRADGQGVPVIFLTARDSLDDTLLGFASGGDDYMVKPCALPELQARLRAVVARARAAPVITNNRRRDVAGLVVDQDQHRVCYGDREVRVTPTGFTLLWTLAGASPAVVPRAALVRALWGEEPVPGSDPLRSHLYQVRRALEDAGAAHLLETIRGVGARLG
jgi:DNA-binding response OmpR family regulator